MVGARLGRGTSIFTTPTVTVSAVSLNTIVAVHSPHLSSANTPPLNTTAPGSKPGATANTVPPPAKVTVGVELNKACVLAVAFIKDTVTVWSSRSSTSVATVSGGTSPLLTSIVCAKLSAAKNIGALTAPDANALIVSVPIISVTAGCAAGSHINSTLATHSPTRLAPMKNKVSVSSSIVLISIACCKPPNRINGAGDARMSPPLISTKFTDNLDPSANASGIRIPLATVNGNPGALTLISIDDTLEVNIALSGCGETSMPMSTVTVALPSVTLAVAVQTPKRLLLAFSTSLPPVPTNICLKSFENSEIVSPSSKTIVGGSINSRDSLALLPVRNTVSVSRSRSAVSVDTVILGTTALSSATVTVGSSPTTMTGGAFSPCAKTS